MPGENVQDWSVTAANNGSADSGINWAEGQARATVNDSARSMMAAIAKDRNLKNGSITTGGSANAQTFTSGVGYSGAVPTGLRVKLKIGAALTNTGATTLNMDAIGAATVKAPDGAALTGGELIAGAYSDFVFDGTSWWLQGTAISGLVKKAGDTMSGDLNIVKSAPQLKLLSTDATAAAVVLGRSGLNRWQLLETSEAESGGNVGSNFSLLSYDDAGAPIGSLIKADRKTGRVEIYGRTDGSAVTTSFQGEFLDLGPNSGGPLPNGSGQVMLSTSIPAGEWDLWAQALLAGTAGLGASGSISLASGTIDLAAVTTTIIHSGGAAVLALPRRVNFATATNVFFNAFVFGSGVNFSNTYLRCRRAS